MSRQRLDHLLVARGLFATRAQAQAAIAAGGVSVDGAPARKASQSVPEDAVVAAQPAHPWASRAGVKLAHALDTFAVDPAGRASLDVGASTGGFVDVLLANGARHVTAVDVGRDQLLDRLREDARVTAHEGLDARALTPAHMPEPPSLIVADLSFIAVEKALGPALALAAPAADVIALFKPQFQVGRAHVGKGGVVKDPAAIAAGLARLVRWLDAQGWATRAASPSPIAGGDGNRETLLWARRR